jgi:pilus assembly protein Flp/PilA
MGAFGQALNCLSWRFAFRLRRNCSGQDLLEYALMAGFIAVMIGAMVPTKVVPSLSIIYTKVNNILASTTGT